LLTEHPKREPKPEPVTGAKRVVFLVLAAIFFVFGAAGAILPVLPTTPFLLLTSYLLLRTSPKLNERLLNSKLFGPILTDWQERRGVKRHIKVKAVFIVLAALAATLAFTNAPAVAKYVIAGLGFIGILVVLNLPEIEP
jgi:uncharacterized membrane protein YbaN (DUF454 family)